MEISSYTVEKIAAIINGEIIGKNNDNLIIKDLLFDSRLLLAPENTLFFALKSSSNDGHKYIGDLYHKGVRAFVVEDLPEIFHSIQNDEKHNDNIEIDDAIFIKVENTLNALQQLTAYHRQQFDIPVIGITGSNGKTIIKEWLYQIFSPDFSVIRSPKSYNSQIGVPLSVWQMNDNHQLAIFEAGISRPEEMQKLQQIIRPKIGLFTNIGQAHGKNFKNIRQKIEEKLKLFKDVNILVYCLDNENLREAINKLNINTFTWSRKDKSANIFINEIDKKEKNTIIKGIYQDRENQIVIPFTDDASIENAIHCWAISLLFKIPEDKLIKRMSHLNQVAMRMELKSGINNCMIINDSYNSDFNALTIALNFMNQQHHQKKRVVILSDILQSELTEEDLYAKIAQLVKNKGVDLIIGIGEAISRQKDKFDIDKDFYLDTKDFLANYNLASFHNQLILLKGARDFEFERISKILQEKAHETILEINLDNLVKNMNYYRSKLKKDTKLMVMVKAFAYGSGNFEISNVLAFHHADYLTVAYADEGIELRKKGINLPIMVMTPEKNTFESIIKNNLEPDIHSFRSLSLLEDTINQLDTPLLRPVGIHIKLDTGMHRLGFLPNEIDHLIERLKSNSNIRIQSILSHLAGSDSEEFNDFSMQQIHVFEEGSSKITAAFPYKILRHILNTAGITRFTDYQYDMVRLGIGIYGIAPCREDEGKLHNVVSLKSTIVNIKEYEAGETVGYCRRGVIGRHSRIGVIPIGYADGLRRQLGNGKACFWVNGKPAPIIGNICMDLCMIDVTGIDCKEDDTAILFDENHPVEDIAKSCATIPYEILTGISQRVKRVYYQE